MKQNVQRTLAIELQKLSVQFRKQQKQFLKKLSQKDGVQLSSSSLSVLDEAGPSRGGEDDFDPGFSDLQARHIPPLSPLFLSNPFVQSHASGIVNQGFEGFEQSRRLSHEVRSQNGHDDDKHCCEEEAALHLLPGSSSVSYGFHAPVPDHTPISPLVHCCGFPAGHES